MDVDEGEAYPFCVRQSPVAGQARETEPDRETTVEVGRDPVTGALGGDYGGYSYRICGRGTGPGPIHGGLSAPRHRSARLLAGPGSLAN